MSKGGQENTFIRWSLWVCQCGLHGHLQSVEGGFWGEVASQEAAYSLVTAYMSQENSHMYLLEMRVVIEQITASDLPKLRSEVPKNLNDAVRAWNLSSYPWWKGEGRLGVTFHEHLAALQRRTMVAAS